MKINLLGKTIIILAAVGASAFAVKYFYFDGNNSTDSKKIEIKSKNSEEGKKTNQTYLPDNTKIITLGRGKVTPDSSFSQSRTASLKGTAYFKVLAGSQPYSIQFPKVLFKTNQGEFVLSSMNGEITLSVLSDSVEITLKNNRKVSIGADTEVTYSIQKNTVSKPKPLTKNRLYWATGELVFNSTPVNRVVVTLRRNLDVKVTLKNPEIGKCTFTASFTNPTAEEVINTLASQLSLTQTYSEELKQFELDGKGCIPVETKKLQED